MNRIYDDGKKITLYLDGALLGRLQEIADLRSERISRLINQALEDWLKTA